MKKLFQKHKILAVLVLVLGLLLVTVFVPLCINWLYGQPAPIQFFSVKWEAKDALAFYGTVLAAVVTIIGVFLSIKQAQATYHNDEINKVKPYFALSYYNIHYHYSPFEDGFRKDVTKSDKEDDENYYEEVRTQKVYIIIEESGIRFMDGLSKEQQERLEHLGYEWQSSGNKAWTLCRRHLLSLPFDAENIGNGAAIDTRIAFNKQGNIHRSTVLYTVRKDSSFYFQIYCENADILANGNYEIALKYSDTIGNSYVQKYPVFFKKAEKENQSNIIATIDFTGKQEKFCPDTEDINGKDEI